MSDKLAQIDYKCALWALLGILEYAEMHGEMAMGRK